MTASELARLEAIIDASGVAARIEALLPVGVRPRQLTARTLLIGILLCLADHRPAHLARIHKALIGLCEAEKRRLGVIAQIRDAEHRLTYRQLEYTFAAVVKALSKETPDGKPSQKLSEVIESLLEGSVQVLGAGRLPQSSSLAIDWSDYESFACPPRKRAAQSADGEEPQSAASSPGGAQAQSTAAKQDAAAGQDAQSEGEPPDCADPEAAFGHRKVNHPSKSEMFFGYYLQAATIVAEENGPQVPELVARITLTSCKEDPPEQIVPVIERMAEDGIQFGDMLADSGYSYRAPETFAAPLRRLGAKLVIDIHPNDRGMKGAHQGAIIAGGNLYCPATPKALFELGPAHPGATGQELAAHDQKSEELSRYKLSPLTAPDADGYHRVICPAVKGKIRCPHRAASMALSHERPTISGPPEHPPACCTQKSITVPGSVNAKTAQKHDFPSKAHRLSYARRTASERSFSRLYDPAATDISRGWSRLMGLTANALMLTCAAITANIATAEAFAARQAEDERRAEHGLPPRRRRRRRESLHEITANAHAPPQLAA